MVFNHTIHHIADHYALVRGGLELLDQDTKKMFVHVHRSSTGFEALTDQVEAVRKLFGYEVVIERASLEDIMYYMKGGGRGCII